MLALLSVLEIANSAITVCSFKEEKKNWYGICTKSFNIRVLYNGIVKLAPEL